MMKMISTILVLSLALVACKNASTEDSGTKGKEEMASEKELAASSKNDPAPMEAATPKEAEKTKEEPVAEMPKKSYDPTPKAADWKAPNVVKVQHILIAVKGARQAAPTALPAAEARKKAEDICDRIRAGEDINKLMREFSGDPGPGIYSMVEKGSAPGAYPRSGMAPAFGDVSYMLDVGECAITEFSATRSPFGYHIIKRLE